MVNFVKLALPSDDEVQAALSAVASGPRPASELIQTIPTERQAFVFRALGWLVKLGVLKVCS